MSARTWLTQTQVAAMGRTQGSGAWSPPTPFMSSSMHRAHTGPHRDTHRPRHMPHRDTCTETYTDTHRTSAHTPTPSEEPGCVPSNLPSSGTCVVIPEGCSHTHSGLCVQVELHGLILAFHPWENVLATIRSTRPTKHKGHLGTRTMLPRATLHSLLTSTSPANHPALFPGDLELII